MGVNRMEIDNVFNTPHFKRMLDIQNLMESIEFAFHARKYLKMLRLIKKLESAILQINGE